MLSLPDIFQVLLARFISLVWSTTLEFMVLGLRDLASLSRFLQAE